jgi:vesicle coat complex subunit
MSIRAPRKGENYELSVDLNSEYRDKRKDAIKRVIASMTVGKGAARSRSICLLRLTHP